MFPTVEIALSGSAFPAASEASRISATAGSWGSSAADTSCGCSTGCSCPGEGSTRPCSCRSALQRATSRAMDVRLSLGSLGVLQPAQAFPRGPCGPYEGRKCWRHAARGSRGGWREKHKLEGISPAGSRRLSVMTRRGWNFQKNTPKVKPW